METQEVRPERLGRPSLVVHLLLLHNYGENRPDSALPVPAPRKEHKEKGHMSVTLNLKHFLHIYCRIIIIQVWQSKKGLGFCDEHISHERD